MVGELIKTRSKEAVAEDIERLRDWLDKQPHLPHDVEDVILSAFVQGTNTLEAAKRKLDNYYSIRSRSPKIFGFGARDASLPSYRERSKSLKLLFLPKVAPGGERVMFCAVTEDFEQFFDHQHEVARILMLLELAFTRWPEASGVRLVVDMKGLPASVVTKLSPASMATLFGAFQDAYPMKLKGLTYFNSPPIVDFLVNNFIKPFMKQKLHNRVTVSSDDASAIKDFVPQELLPSNYGGKEKSSDELNEYWLSQLEEKRDWFQWTCGQTTDEKKRPPDGTHTYGIEGTFRKLAVD